MKKLFLHVFLGLMWCNVGFAERFLCSYIFNEEARSVVFERKGNFFKKSNGALDRIAFEDEYAIVLENTYTFYGKQNAETYTTLIDKKRLTFVMIGLEYKDNTSVNEGKCQTFN
tara:strand:- start:52 stop:393 length:342 start_codon:yes stop_codon:yes gene_type:complete